MEERLNKLKENKSIILEKIIKMDTKEISKKWYALYEIGYIAVIIAAVLLFSDNLLLAFLLSIGYGVLVPGIRTVINNSKREKLRKEYTSIGKEIYEIEKQLNNKKLTEKERQKQILFTPYKPLKITEETRNNVLEHPELHSGLSVRARMGMFYTDEEYEQRREKLLNTPLPDDEKKGYTRKKKR